MARRKRTRSNPEESVPSFLESCFRPQPSHSHTKMETTTTTQLAKLNAEIDAITLLIASEKTELKSAAEADKADLRTSIERLNSRLEALIASLIRYTPALRLRNFEQVLAHPWFGE